jgi:ribosomal protein L5
MNITICTKCSSDDETRDLLKAFGLPFRRDDTQA